MANRRMAALAVLHSATRTDTVYPTGSLFPGKWYVAKRITPQLHAATARWRVIDLSWNEIVDHPKTAMCKAAVARTIAGCMRIQTMLMTVARQNNPALVATGQICFLAASRCIFIAGTTLVEWDTSFNWMNPGGLAPTPARAGEPKSIHIKPGAAACSKIHPHQTTSLKSQSITIVSVTTNIMGGYASHEESPVLLN